MHDEGPLNSCGMSEGLLGADGGLSSERQWEEMAGNTEVEITTVNLSHSHWDGKESMKW